jgi:hypothetical protein
LTCVTCRRWYILTRIFWVQFLLLSSLVYHT